MIYAPALSAPVELYILRHGEAGKRLAAGSKDSERPLTVAGEQEVKEIAGALVDLGIKLDFVAASPLARARQTAEIVVKKLKVKKGKFELWNELKPEGSRLALYSKLAQFKPGDSVMVVGHEPYLSSLVGDLMFDSQGSSSGGGSNGRIVLKKAGLARVSVTSLRPRARGELRWLLTPRHMRRMMTT
ncbi:phosphohistidine phosphatase, SixA [Candidatus Nitrososphaera evergladensis SR1]|uniref:Phosphohistidine phosphatase, SixA n=1 Tax=Candidatus Nitrososphaera evergladensis SR1 TaxID=1459636 RepID=A0A075MLI7_9ARCH|nr:phosphohistidine phosphatase, SixA [Candidatus Nitrososphaera evergladensis SR1]